MAKKNKVIDLFGGKNVIKNTREISYSKLLEQFLVPFENDFPEDFYLEDIFGFAVNAWNFGNMSMLVPKEEFKKIMNLAAKEVDYFPLLKKMVDYKAANFKAYSNFITDFEISEENRNDVLTVVTQEAEDYLAEMASAFEDGLAGDFEENYINRSAIILKPLKPFADWLFNLYPEDGYPVFIENNIYLVNDEIDDLEYWLKKKFDKFFMLELEDWHTGKKEWPQKRTYKMFKQWFQVEFSTMVYDTERKPVGKSE